MRTILLMTLLSFFSLSAFADSDASCSCKADCIVADWDFKLPQSNIGHQDYFFLGNASRNGDSATNALSNLYAACGTAFESNRSQYVHYDNHGVAQPYSLVKLLSYNKKSNTLEEATVLNACTCIVE